MREKVVYIVKISNGDYSPSYPYKGESKDVAIAIASAYIAKGRRVTVIENHQALTEVEQEGAGK